MVASILLISLARPSLTSGFNLVGSVGESSVEIILRGQTSAPMSKYTGNARFKSGTDAKVRVLRWTKGQSSSVTLLVTRIDDRKLGEFRLRRDTKTNGFKPSFGKARDLLAIYRGTWVPVEGKTAKVLLEEYEVG